MALPGFRTPYLVNLHVFTACKGSLFVWMPYIECHRIVISGHICMLVLIRIIYTF